MLTRIDPSRGESVNDILLDTGYSQTLVRQKLVPVTMVMDQRAPICSAHSDMVRYPMADVQVRVGDVEFTIKAGVSGRQSTSVL